MINLDIEIKLLKKELKSQIESVVLFGSYSRGEEKQNSDIDLLIITKNKENEELIEEKLNKINPKIQILLFSKSDFKEKVISFNHQLITMFYDGIILYDINNFYYKMENLFLALNRKNDFKLKFRNRVITMRNLLEVKNFV